MSLDIRRSLVLPSIVVVAGIAAACSSGGGAATVAPSVAAPSTAASVEPSSAAPSSAAPSEAASPSAASGVSLALADSALGKIIVDGTGRTLYMFTPDDGAAKPTCTGACADNWPALTATDAASVTAGTGLDASKISIVDRGDGTKQVKYGDYPLYFFAKDTAAGQTNGQGLVSKWYVVGADGEPIKS
jgi:predicted lipoprotein with Yx(FWY)xxD motif